MTEPLPLVLVPGRMSTATSWTRQTEAFAGTRAVIVPDGHHHLPSMAAMAAHVAERLPPRFDLAGWSMGGYIVFELLPLVADRVRRLILVATSARPESAESRVARLALLDLAEREGVAATRATTWRKSVHDLSRIDPGLIAQLEASAESLGLAVLRSQTAAIIARRDHRPTLPSIACPTLVVVGEHDRVTPVECSREIAAGIPSATLHIVPDAGHCPPYEAPETVNRLIGAFLAAPDQHARSKSA